jgi:cell division protein FtsB
MAFQKLKQNRFFRGITNTFVLIFIPYAVWMLFFDENSYLVHRELNKEIDKLEETNLDYKTKIEKDQNTIEKLKDTIELIRFAREKYYMKKENEDIYIIEFDTLKKH